MTTDDRDDTPILQHATVCPHCDETLFGDETCESVDCMVRGERLAAEHEREARRKRR